MRKGPFLPPLHTLFFFQTFSSTPLFFVLRAKKPKADEKLGNQSMFSTQPSVIAVLGHAGRETEAHTRLPAVCRLSGSYTATKMKRQKRPGDPRAFSWTNSADLRHLTSFERLFERELVTPETVERKLVSEVPRSATSFSRSQQKMN